jgi:hypothetical protein
MTCKGLAHTLEIKALVAPESVKTRIDDANNPVWPEADTAALPQRMNYSPLKVPAAIIAADRKKTPAF